jgi:glycosyltransferase involved in cell wall biosynthesis
MKICFLAGANSLHSHRWIKYFVNKGYKIYWVSLMQSLEPLPDVVFCDIGPLSTNPIIITYQAIKFKQLIRKIKPDILHIHSVGTYGVIGAFANFHPMIATAWGSDVLIAGKSIIKRPLVKFVLRNADLITCDADHMIDNMVKLGTDIRKIKLVYFGTELDKFKPGAKDRDQLDKWRVCDSPTVISLRNLEPIYDIETLIKSIPIVLRYVPETKFIIAGTGSQEKYLQDLAKSLGVIDSIRFIGRYLHNDLPTYLNSVDIYVSTSLSDAGIAASTAEAMACGLPVIITDSGENKKWINDGKNGFVVPIKKPDILAEKVTYLLRNNEIRKQLGINGRKTIEDKNNYYKEMGKMEELYEKILAAR